MSENSMDSSSSSSSYCSTCDGSLSPDPSRSTSNLASPERNVSSFNISLNVSKPSEEDEAVFKAPEPVLFASVKEAIDDLNGKHPEANTELDKVKPSAKEASNVLNVEQSEKNTESDKGSPVAKENEADVTSTNEKS